MVEIRIIASLYSLNSVENRFILPFHANCHSLVYLPDVSLVPICAHHFLRGFCQGFAHLCCRESCGGASVPWIPLVPTPQAGILNAPGEVTAWLARVSPPVAILETPEAWSVLAALTSQKRAGTQTYP